MPDWNFIGNEPAVDTLSRALAHGRLAQAYLFVGPRGVGKRTLALKLAQALNCKGSGGAAAFTAAPPVAGGPCGACSPCRRIASGQHPDVQTIALEGNQRELSIERVRELQRAASLQAFEGGWRVFVVRGAERLSPPAANALLKTLEEPPPRVLLALTTAGPDEILETIRSRCRPLHLWRMPAADLAAALEQRLGISPEAAGALAGYAQGCPGLALAAAAEPDLMEAVQDSLDQMKALLPLDIAERLEQAPALGEGGEARRQAAVETLHRWELWWRDLLLVRAGCYEGLVYPQEREHYVRFAAALDYAGIRAGLSALAEARRRMELNANARLAVDALVLTLPRVNTRG